MASQLAAEIHLSSTLTVQQSAIAEHESQVKEIIFLKASINIELFNADCPLHQSSARSLAAGQ